MCERYNSFNSFLKNKFGQRVHRISINAGFNCPNLDGKLSSSGCIYCNNYAFSGSYLLGYYYQSAFIDTIDGKIQAIRRQIEEGIRLYKENYKINKFIAYFQSFTNTYSDIDTLKKCYDIIKDYAQIVGLFISTRPDCIDKNKLELIAEYSKDYLVWVEYGLQTTNNKILELINRNHNYEDFLSALYLTKKYDLRVGVHIILGLPSATYEDIMEDARKLSRLPVDAVKFHVLNVVKNTKLENLFLENKVNLMSRDEYIKTICDFLERIPENIVIFRLLSDANSKFLIAPSWINQKQKVLEDIKQELIKRNTRQGTLAKNL